jgi:hypothetical protein
MPIRTFRGLIADGGLDYLSLHTNDGSTGYRIVKFQIITPQPGAITTELVVKIYKVPQTTATATVDFSDQRLLAVATFQQHADSWNTYDTILFDREIFNQDLYLTCQDTQNADGANYYIELEQVKLDLNENTVATLKDIRNTVGTS